MESYEGTAKSSIELESQPDDKEILVLPRTLSKADRIRGVTRSLVVDALAILDKMWDDCQQPPDLRENYYLLHHYLDYLKRFCEGRA